MLEGKTVYSKLKMLENLKETIVFKNSSNCNTLLIKKNSLGDFIKNSPDC